MGYPYQHISILVMPVTRCNIKCKYCFKSNDYDNCTMSHETLKRLIDISLPFYRKVSFIWHGGEPLLAGLDFFESAVRLQKEHPNTIVTNSMQSNLTLLDADLASFLRENSFTIGGSFDGTTNDETRGHSDSILKGRSIAIDAGLKCGTICVVSSKNIDSLIDDYIWFNESQINYTLNPYLTGDQADWFAVPEDVYVAKMIDLFDFWAHDTNCKISLKTFESYVEYIANNKKSLCSYTSCLGKWLGVYPNGDIYPCNRVFPQSYCFGNVHDYSNIQECFNSKGFEKLIKEAIKRRNKCSSCPIFGFCSGGCNHNALLGGSVENNGGFQCKTLIPIFSHVESCFNTWKSQDNIEELLNPFIVRKLDEAKEVTKP